MSQVPRRRTVPRLTPRRSTLHRNLNRTLEQAALKWGFIRSSMLKFGDDAVPFLVYRYTSQMTSSLQQAVELATSEVAKPTIGPPE